MPPAVQAPDCALAPPAAATAQDLATRGNKLLEERGALKGLTPDGLLAVGRVLPLRAAAKRAIDQAVESGVLVRVVSGAPDEAPRCEPPRALLRTNTHSPVQREHITEWWYTPPPGLAVGWSRALICAALDRDVASAAVPLPPPPDWVLQKGSPAKRRGWLRCLMPWNAAAVQEDVEPDSNPFTHHGGGAMTHHHHAAFGGGAAPLAIPVPSPHGNGRPAAASAGGAAAGSSPEEDEPGTPGSVLVRDDVPDDYDGSYGSGLADGGLPPVEVHANEPYCRPGGASTGQLAVLVEGPLDKEAVFLRACEQAGPGFSVYVGDGLNDLLALLSADCGILIGAGCLLACVRPFPRGAGRTWYKVAPQFSRRCVRVAQARARRCSARWLRST